MRAVVVEEFGVTPSVRSVPDPAPVPDGVVIEVAATGLCRSDWHAWSGHDPEVRLPHVPGHEFAGTVAGVGAEVTAWRPGDRVTAPFVCACGTCPPCLAGDHQVCARQTQPGFTHWGSFARYVAVRHADVNLVRLPDDLSYPAAAALGCRFATAYRAVVGQGGLRAGEWLVVYGCGGVGLSAVMIGVACGARVIAVDVSAPARAAAERFGACASLDPGADGDASTAIRELTGGGAQVSIDAVGSAGTCAAAVRSLRRRGRHVQVGLLPAALAQPALPWEHIIGYELVVLGSHGLAAHAYPGLLGLVSAGVLRPDRLVLEFLPLDAVPEALAAMDQPGRGGIRLIEP